MSISTSSSNRKCVTCKFWQGSRRASSLRDYVQWESNQGKAGCVLDRSGRQSDAMESCSKWEQWL